MDSLMQLATSNFGSGLIGAVVGGVFSLIGAQVQSTKSLQAARDERQALLQQEAASRIVDAMFEIKRLLRDLPEIGSDIEPWVAWSRERTGQLDRARSTASLLPEPFKKRVVSALRGIAAAEHPRVLDRHVLRSQGKEFADDAQKCMEYFLSNAPCPEPSPMVEIIQQHRDRERIRREAREAEDARQLEAETVPEPDFD